MLYLIAAATIVLTGWLLHRFKRPGASKEVAKIITMPPSPIAKEYAWLYDRIVHAPTITELAYLESESIEFKTTFGLHTYVDDLYNNLVQELRLRRYILADPKLGKVIK